MWISKYFVLFTIFSCFGWIYETTYVTLKTGKWDNRGFLFGPVCPIYGAGGVAVGILFDYLQRSGYADSITWWQIFIISYIGSIILEYPTHWFLEKRFHAYWWDYSSAPLNIHGRVCVPASIGFGCAGLLIYYGIYPAVADVVNPIPGIILELLSLIGMGFLAADIALTVAALTNIVKSLESMEDMIDRQMDYVVDNFESRKNEFGNALENREKMTKLMLERSLSNMSGIRKSAIKRIKGFQPRIDTSKPKEKAYEYMNRIWMMEKEARGAFATIKSKLPGQGEKDD